VLALTLEVLRPALGTRGFPRLKVAFSASGPKVLFERTSGDRIRVLLSAKDARWDQFVYQFAHEMCHVLSNFERRDEAARSAHNPAQWLEESLCEAVSLLALEGMATRWRESPPHPGWGEYASAFQAYANRLLAHPHRQSVVASRSEGRWLAQNLPALEANPYDRVLTEYFGTRLFRLFNAYPGGLATIAYLNLGAQRPGADIESYVRDWHEACPADSRAYVANVIELLREMNPEPDATATMHALPDRTAGLWMHDLP
jgi:hypothetical protein